jgi:glycosyltransferase involved in cell wall biosynthesis
MRIGVMLRHFKRQPGGVRTYTNNLLDHLVKLDKINQYVLIYDDKDSVGSYSAYPNVEEIVIKSPSKLTWDQIAMLSVVRNKHLDLIFNPKTSVPLFTNCKKVFVFHGGDWFTFPQNYGILDRFYHNIAAPIYCKKADAVISVSNSATEHITSALRVDPVKIRTVYHGVSGDFRPIEDERALETVRQQYRLPDDFILYVGQIYPMKNVGGIIRAFLKVREKLPHKLVLVGVPGPNSKSDLALINELQLQDDVILTGWIPDEHLPAMYNLADLFVFPSFYEGFGIPLLEAMACGCPIVTSNIDTPVEVVDDAAILVDPSDVNSISEGIYEGLTNQSLRQDLIQKGFKRVKNFGWEESAQDTLALFEWVARDIEL